MKEYHIFSCATTNFFPFVKSLASALKKFKKKDCKYIYHLFISTDDLQSFKNKLDYLISQDFNIQIKSTKQYEGKIVNPNQLLHWSSYFRLFACSLFPNLDKILYLDTDILILNKGLEQFLDVDITNYYCSAVLDVVPVYKNKKEIQNTKNPNYFNAGVTLLNLKKIRQDGLNKIMQDAITGKWPFNEVKPTFYDQSLLNYLFRNNVLLVNPKFNNNFHCSLTEDLKYFIAQYSKWGYKDLLDSINQAVIIHWAGVKPWWVDYFNERKTKMPVWQITQFLFEYFINKGIR